MRPLPILRFFASSLFLSAAALAEDGFTPLFNGRDLAGWVNINCAPDTFFATNGIVHCTGFPTGILRTERMYQNFVLDAEWRHLKPKGNSGIYVWADPVPAVGQPFVRAVEVQVLDGLESEGYTSDGDIFPIHGAKMVPENNRKGGDRAFPTEKRMKPSPEWNHYRVECIDGDISLAVNGKVVTRGHRATPRKGYIGLESEGSPAEFRNLRVKELPAAASLAPEDIAVPPEGFRPLYTGVDLRGWTVATGASAPWKPDDWQLTSAATTGAPMVSRGEFGDGELLFDWRWTDAKQQGDWTRLVQFRRLDLPGLLARASAVKPAEAAAGKWNRVRITLRGNRASVTLNDRPLLTDVTAADVPARGVIEIRAAPVPAQLANLLFKPLD